MKTKKMADRITLMLAILMAVFVLGDVTFAQVENNIESEVLSLYEKADKQLARFAVFSNSSSDFYVYYQTKDERDSNKPLENYVWIHLVSTNDWPQGDFYDLLKTKNTGNRIFYGVNGFDVLPSTEYFYEIRDKSKSIIKAGAFVSKPPLDRSTLGYSVLKDYLEVDYLNDQNEQASKNAGFYAALRAKYQDRTEYQLTKKIVDVTFYNKATNITLIAQHGLQGFWPDLYYSTGPYLTKEEYNCFFVNGENLIMVTIKVKEVISDYNAQDNAFAKTLIVKDAEPVKQENCTIDGKIYSAEMRVEWSGKDQNKPIEFINDKPVQNTENKDSELPKSEIQDGTTVGVSGNYQLAPTAGGVVNIKIETTKSNKETILTEKTNLSTTAENNVNTGKDARDEIKVTTQEEVKVENKKLYMGDKEIKVMPSTASQTAINTLRLEKGVSIQLKDTGKPVYEIEGIKKVKLFALFGTNMKIKIRISADSGNIEKIDQPWWSFLAK